MGSCSGSRSAEARHACQFLQERVISECSLIYKVWEIFRAGLTVSFSTFQLALDIFQAVFISILEHSTNHFPGQDKIISVRKKTHKIVCPKYMNG